MGEESGYSRAVSIDAEQCLIGAVLLNNLVYDRVADIVAAADFFEEIHQSIWEICGDLIRGGKLASPITVKNYIPPGIKIFGELTAQQYVARLAANGAAPITAPDYAHVVRDLSDRRRLHGIGERLVLAPGTAPIDAAIDPMAAEAIADLDKVLGGRVRQYTPQVTIGQAAVRAVDAAAEAYQRDGALSGVTWGLAALDRKTLGMQRGELIVVAGRPGAGKTAFALTTARLAAQSGKRTLFCSLEMGDIMLAQRALSDEMYDTAPLSYYRIKGGRFTEANYLAIKEAAGRLALLPLTIEQRPALGIGQISAIARQHKRSPGLDLLVVDHLHLVRASDRYSGNKVAEVGEVSSGLKAIARDLDIPVLALCQLSRQVESREDKRPMLSDLKWAGEIEQDADTVAMLYRQGYYLQRQTDADSEAKKLTDVMTELEVLIEKQRQGPTGSVKLFCSIEHNAVRDVQVDRTAGAQEAELF